MTNRVPSFSSLLQRLLLAMTCFGIFPTSNTVVVTAFYPTHSSRHVNINSGRFQRQPMTNHTTTRMPIQRYVMWNSNNNNINMIPQQQQNYMTQVAMLPLMLPKRIATLAILALAFSEGVDRLGLLDSPVNVWKDRVLTWWDVHRQGWNRPLEKLSTYSLKYQFATGMMMGGMVLHYAWNMAAVSVTVYLLSELYGHYYKKEEAATTTRFVTPQWIDETFVSVRTRVRVAAKDPSNHIRLDICPGPTKWGFVLGLGIGRFV